MDKVTISYQDKDGYNQNYIINLEAYDDTNISINKDKNGKEVIGYTITRNGYILDSNETNEDSIENSVIFINEYVFNRDSVHVCYQINYENGNLLSAFSFDAQLNLNNNYDITNDYDII